MARELKRKERKRSREDLFRNETRVCPKRKRQDAIRGTSKILNFYIYTDRADKFNCKS